MDDEQQSGGVRPHPHYARRKKVIKKRVVKKKGPGKNASVRVKKAKREDLIILSDVPPPPFQLNRDFYELARIAREFRMFQGNLADYSIPSIAASRKNMLKLVTELLQKAEMFSGELKVWIDNHHHEDQEDKDRAQMRAALTFVQEVGKGEIDRVLSAINAALSVPISSSSSSKKSTATAPPAEKTQPSSVVPNWLSYMGDALFKSQQAAIATGNRQSAAYNVRSPPGPTRIFDQFIRGITYFSDQPTRPDQHPIYHRTASCGVRQIDNSKDRAFRKDKIQCNNDKTEKTEKTKAHRAYTCFLERLLYEQILLRMQMFGFGHDDNDDDPKSKSESSLFKPPSIDAGHRFRLDLTRQDFETCFSKDAELRIGVEFDTGTAWPVKLFVTLVDADQTVMDVYKRSLSCAGHRRYDSIIECTRTVINNSPNPVNSEKQHKQQTYNHSNFYKAQSFENEAVWKKM